MTPRLEMQATKQSPPECIWSQAGVVLKKSCRKEMDCAACRFDHALRRTAEHNRRMRARGRQPEGKKGRIVSWQENMLRLPPSNRPCIHHMKGHIDFKACSNEYRCGTCEFDQYFEDQYAVHVAVRPVQLAEVGGFKIPQGVYLHRGHTWVKLEEGASVRIGLDDFAFRVLGSPDRIEAPLVGKSVVADQPLIHLQRGDRHAGVLSPVNGVVTAINAELRRDARSVDRAPYTEGWVMRVHAPELRKDLKNLMIGNETGAFLEKEIDQLYEILEETAGPLAADGGQIAPDVFGNLPEIGWQRLVKTFLRTE